MCINLDNYSFSYKNWSDLSGNQKIGIIIGSVLCSLGLLSLVTLAFTQTGILQTILDKFHLPLDSKQILQITIGTAVGASASFLIGLPLTFYRPRNISDKNFLSDTSEDMSDATFLYTNEEFSYLLQKNQPFSGNFVVQGSLELERSNLKSLPENLLVDGSLSLRNCTHIAELPKGLRVMGTLDATRSSLTTLPEGLYVGGDLFLVGCKAAAVLSKGLHVGGDLHLDAFGTELATKIEGVQGKVFCSYTRAIYLLQDS